MYKQLRQSIVEYGERILAQPIAERLEPSLVTLARSGLPPQPTKLALSGARWGGAPAPDITAITLQNDGTLHLEAQPPGSDAIVPDPARWTPAIFQAEVAEHGPLVIVQGGSDIIQANYGTEGSTITAMLNAWCWRATNGDTPVLWAAPLKFWTPKPPIVLWWPDGNARIIVDNRVVKFWRFGTRNGQVFLIRNAERWYIAVEAEMPTGPNADHVHLVRSVLGFTFGEPINVGLFQPVDASGDVRPGLVHIGLLEHRAPHSSRQPPALRFNCSPTWTARFVEGLLCLADDDPNTPLLRAIHMYFAAISGFVESKFLHAWVAAEMVARWGINVHRFPDAGPRRLANHDAWIAWLRSHQADIEALAAPGMGPRLFDRVLSSEIDNPTRVQRAFEGLGLPWTPEMDDAQRSRHGVAHEGTLPGDTRDLDRDWARIGLVTTMLTALLAKAIGYDGPIADRSKTCLNLTGKEEPDWWAAMKLDEDLVYEGSGVAASRQKLVIELAELEAEEQEDPPDAPT